MRDNRPKRYRFRSNGRTQKRNGYEARVPKLIFHSQTNQSKNNFNKNNHNPGRLIEKYNNLAKEALSMGDKVLSENYFQHADHYSRILSNNQILHKEQSEQKKNIKPENNNEEIKVEEDKSLTDK